MRKKCPPPIIGFTLYLPLALYGADMGVVGTVYPITEKNGIEMIKEKAEGWISNSGSDIKSRLKLPAGNVLPEAKETHEHRIQYITDPSSAQSLRMFEKIVFLDADSMKQRDFLKQQLADDKSPVSIIVVQGDVIKLQETIGKSVSFDYHGTLASKFKVTSLPATVVQNQSAFIVREEAL